MALITDPDLLADSTDGSPTTNEVYINTSAKTIKLNAATGDLSSDGVTLKCLYSFLKEEWKNDPLTKSLTAFPFPMTPITDESFEFVEGWDLADTTTEQLIRTAGWKVRNTAGNETKRFAGVVILGSVEANDQLYYNLGVTDPTGATDFALTGAVNQAVQIIDDPNGDGSYVDGFDRTDGMTIFLREQGQLFDSVTNTDIGVPTLDSIAYRFPLNTGSDLNIDTVDTDIKASGSGFPADQTPYSGMSITYENTTVNRTGFTGGSANFGITVDGNGGTLKEVYNFVQYALRQAADINADTPSTVTGDLADELMYYVGPTLYTQRAYNPDIDASVGVFITNFNASDINNVIFVDDTGTEQSYPYTATLTLNFNPNLVNDAAAEYWVYYSTTPVVGRTGSDGAITTATTTFTSATASFVANDVDALILVAGAGAASADLVTRIASVTNGTTVELETAASTTVSGANWEIFDGDWGERGALIVDDASDVDMQGSVSAAALAKTYNYDSNNQGNLGAASDKNVTAVAIGLGTGQWVKATGTIERSTTNSVTLVAPLERNYQNL